MFPRHMCKNCLSCCLDTNQGSMNADRLVRTIPCCREKTRRGRNKRHSFRTGKVHGSRNVSGTKYGHWWPGLWRQSALRLTCWEVGDRGATVHTTHLVKTPATPNQQSDLQWELTAQTFGSRTVSTDGVYKVRAEWRFENELWNSRFPTSWNPRPW